MSSEPEVRRGIRWWPAGVIAALAVVLIVGFQTVGDAPFQWRNMRSIGTGLIAFLLLVLWWLLLSRARWTLRLAGFVGLLALLGAGKAMFRLKGVSGDLMPIFEPRWAKAAAPAASTNGVPAAAAGTTVKSGVKRADFPQFLGPARTAIIDGIALDPDWAAHPPKIVWRQPVGPAWSGFVIVGERALTQEQDGEKELVTCRDVSTGQKLWVHDDAARYFTPIAGEGPRTTPTVVSNRVYTLGATGRLNCLDLETGKPVWSRDMAADAGAKMPEWGYSGSPLFLDGLIVVSAGGHPGKSLLAYRADTGDVAWTAGDAGASYGSPVVGMLGGTRQILAFNAGRITGHDASGGRVLWEYKWGTGMPHVAIPILAGPDTVMFSSGYAVGSELLKVAPGADGAWTASQVWASKKMKAKFANPVARGGYVYGLDDGILACIDLKDGSQRWKEGRYGHGQGLLVGEHFLLMSEAGELVLLKPTPDAPNELQRLKIFDAKTWNPIALAGDIVIVRNDVEAVSLKIALRP